MSGKSLTDLRKLQRHQINKVNKEELIDAILSASNDEASAQSRQDEKLDLIVKELAGMRKMFESSERESVARIKEMTETIEKQSAVIMQHQLFLEQLDRTKRETNLVLFGVPDGQVALDGAFTEDDKIKKIFSVVDAEPGAVVRSCRRLGRQEQGSSRPRPLLVRVDSRSVRDGVLERAVKLKDLQEPYKRIYIKKDSHPEVRKEWKRLKDAEEEEKKKPVNVGCNIRLDFKERVLYKDGIVIDRWRPHPF